MSATESMPRSRESRTYLPEQEREELLAFAQVLNGIDTALGKPGQAMLLGPDGQQRTIPAELFEVLEQAAKLLALGDGVTIMPYAAKLTTQEAADFLGISRPTFVKLLESGAIPFDTVGRHRRVLLRDVVDYQDRSRSERRAALTELARDTATGPRLPIGVPALKRESELGG